MSTPNSVPKLYQSVVDDVINNVREAFLDEGVDEQVLQELKQLWDTKLHASKALDSIQPEIDSVVQPHLIMHQQQQHLQQHQQGQQMQTIQLPFQTSNASRAASMALPAGLFQQQLTSLGGIQLQQTGNGQFIAVQSLQPGQATHQATAVPISQQNPAAILQGRPPAGMQLNTNPQPNPTHHQQPPQLQTINPNAAGLIQLDGADSKTGIIQFDGTGDTSSSDDEDFDNDDNDDENDDEKDEDDEGEEEEPLNSDDDVSDDDPTELFETDNVIVCQFDKINRNKNKWKFYFKDGIMNLNGRDFVFQKANGDAEW